MTTSGNSTSPEQEGVSWLFWESAVARAHLKITEAERRDSALSAAGLDHGRQYRNGGGANEAIPAEHAQLALIPKSPQHVIDGIVRLTVRVPLLPVEAVPREQVRAYMQSEAAQNRSMIDDIPSNDIFLEAVREDGSWQRFLLSPEGPRAYNDAGDVYDASPETIQKYGQFFEIQPNLDTMAAQMTLDAEWPSMEAYDNILRQYDLFTQDIAGGPRSSAA